MCTNLVAAIRPSIFMIKMSQGLCCSCYTDESEINCSQGHQYCDECFGSYLRDNISAERSKKSIEHYSKKGTIPCIYNDCKGSFDEDDILGLSKETMKEYCKTSKILCSEMAEMERQNLMNNVIHHQDNNKQIVETIVTKIREILTNCISCPYCGKTFFDFEGCLALNCSYCDNGFCGLCLKKHDSRDPDSTKSALTHTWVTECSNKLQGEVKELYGINGYFMNSAKWPLWKERIQIVAINTYLKTLNKEIVLGNVNYIIAEIQNGKHLTQDGLNSLTNMLFSHDVDHVYLIRIPVMFWLIYSAKHSMKFEETVKKIVFSPDERKDVGTFIVQSIRKEFPKWKDVKNYVPGESFQAINYPPEFLERISKLIEAWGIKNKKWN